MVLNVNALLTGAFKEIPELIYNKSLDLPRRTRQFAWRTRLEKVFSTAQIAVEVCRFLSCSRFLQSVIQPESNILKQFPLFEYFVSNLVRAPKMEEMLLSLD
jgi:hypothetical protein